MTGGDGNDSLSGDAGADNLSGQAGADVIDGGDGSDTLSGGIADDSLVGGAADDFISGGDGSDSLTGSAGNDTLRAASSQPHEIYGLAGVDVLAGAAGAVFQALADGRGSASALISALTRAGEEHRLLAWSAHADEQAIIDALRETRIAGAGLDVFWTEPMGAEHPLYAFDNAVLTPHLGYVERDQLERYYNDQFNRVLAFEKGAPVDVANPQALAVR